MFIISRRCQASGRRAAASRGVALIEAIIFIVIIGLGLAGVISVFNVVTRHSADPLIRKQMLTLAEALMDEVLLRPFTFCNGTDANVRTATAANITAAGGHCAAAAGVQGYGHDVGTTRATFSNLTNYCDVTPANSTSCPPMTLGVVGDATSVIHDISGIGGSPQGYWAIITLAAEALNGIASADPAGAADATGLNVIRVTVEVGSAADPEGTVRLDSYRTRWAGNVP